MAIRKILAFALMSLSFHAFGDEIEIEVLEPQMAGPPPTEAPIGGDFDLEITTDATCGDARLSSFYDQAKAGFEIAEKSPTGKVDVRFGSTSYSTRFVDVSCPGNYPFIQLENGGNVTVTGVFGSYLPSPMSSTVFAYYGNIFIPAANGQPALSLNNAKFWLDTNGSLTGLLLVGPSAFVFTSKWWAL